MGNRLKELRIEKGLRLIDVANAVGLTLMAISNYEQGIREPSIAILIKLCDFFEVSADYLIGRTDSY
ncbi:MAG: helix-turn-helix transcriptional regulator [Clostridia bacterium]|nr:helix-turn-helix transcriptional regulator [Clostridia bacterium]